MSGVDAIRQDELKEIKLALNSRKKNLQNSIPHRQSPYTTEELTANEKKTDSFTFGFRRSSINQQLVEAAAKGNVEQLINLANEWFNNPVLNKTGKIYDGRYLIDEATPLGAAAKNGHIDCVRILLAQPAIKINQTDTGNYTALKRAARSGHVDIVELLCSFTDVDKSNIVDICNSCIVDNEKISQRIKDIIDESYAEKDITKMFQRATKLQQLNASYIVPTRIQIARNWSLEASSEDKKAIFDAIINGNSDVLRTLMQKWFANRVLNELCDIPNRPFAKTVPLCHAVGLQWHECVKILLDQPGIDVNAREDINYDGNKYYFTALHTAVRAGNLEMIQTLCQDPDIDILAKDAFRKTALHWACYMGSQNDQQKKTGNLDVVKYLLLMTDDKSLPLPFINWWDSSIRTPLHWASIGGNLEIVKYLICKITGLTEEQIANENPTEGMDVKTYLNIKFAISNTDAKGNTPYGLAKTNDIKKLFKKLGADYSTEQSSQKYGEKGYSGLGFGTGGNKPRRSKKRKHSVKRNARNNKKRTLTHRSSKYSRM
jgi:ankyrin repeat protein